MLHAAAVMIGLFLLWLILAPPMHGADDFLVAAAAALAGLSLAARLGGLGRGAFTHPLQLALLTVGRAGAVFAGAFSTLRAGLAADVSLRPALVRVKLRPSSDLSRATLVAMIGAAPGSMVVEADQEGLLAHVLDEHAIDAADVGALEARVITALDGARAS